MEAPKLYFAGLCAIMSVKEEGRYKKMDDLELTVQKVGKAK